jgi:hypothetical protein
MTIETLTFRLADGVDEATFLDADRRAQTDVYYRSKGCLRRTTARSADGEWLVTVLWGSPEGEATAPELDALMDPSSVRRARYETLD